MSFDPTHIYIHKRNQNCYLRRSIILIKCRGLEKEKKKGKRKKKTKKVKEKKREEREQSESKQ